ncbi:MAG: 23S rRNA (pseudouridine(1915)-N(3))-methyltransferase RlmH [Alphaproteobacteria bacterium]|nr:23S rRNA (pseudouridine(1915)-N(3))-methyltransferase RlmH [Alphaproteobacteria bacterium]
MEIGIAAVGRLRRGPLADLYRDYCSRLPWTVVPHEIDPAPDRRAADGRRRESDALAAALPDTGPVVVLDQRGQTLSSEAFAQRLATWRDGGVRRVSFIIGGADGLDRRLIERADLVMNFGAMTWPHLLVRVMLAEQLYRASSLLAGHPYHRGEQG